MLYDDGCSGATSVKKLWKESCASGEMCIGVENQEVITACDCCTEYAQWKATYSDATKALQLVADEPHYYKVCTDEVVHIDSQVYQGTIRALSSAPKGRHHFVDWEASLHMQSM